MTSGRKHTRLTIDVPLPSKEVRTAFKNRLASVTDLLSLPGGPKLNKLGLMTALTSWKRQGPTLVRTALLLWYLLEAYCPSQLYT